MPPRILFFALRYHGYTDALVAEMAELGFRVTLVDLQPRNPWFKALRTLLPWVYARMQAAHLDRAIAAAKGQDYAQVIFLQAHQMRPDQLARLRADHPGRRFALYNWDSLATHDFRPQAGFFDQVFSFDPVDAKAHGLTYLPLFATRLVQSFARDRGRAGAVYMVGNLVNPDRYLAVAAFRAEAAQQGLVFRDWLKVTPVVLATMLRRRILPRKLRIVDISQATLREMVETSLAVFDFANHQQAGQTMRVIENLVAGKKIITNNAAIRAESFYSPDRIHVFDGLDFGDLRGFLETPLADPDQRFEQFHIQNFTATLLGLRR
jgi:hypothetical protein